MLDEAEAELTPGGDHDEPLKPHTWYDEKNRVEFHYMFSQRNQKDREEI